VVVMCPKRFFPLPPSDGYDVILLLARRWWLHEPSWAPSQWQQLLHDGVCCNIFLNVFYSDLSCCCCWFCNLPICLCSTLLCVQGRLPGALGAGVRDSGQAAHQVSNIRGLPSSVLKSFESGI